MPQLHCCILVMFQIIFMKSEMDYVVQIEDSQTPERDSYIINSYLESQRQKLDKIFLDHDGSVAKGNTVTPKHKILRRDCRNFPLHATPPPSQLPGKQQKSPKRKVSGTV